MSVYVKPMEAQEVLPLLRPAEKKALLALDDRPQTCKQLGTVGRVLWELNDFRRDIRGIAPPTAMVWYDEDYGWRGWALTPLGEEVRNLLVNEA